MAVLEAIGWNQGQIRWQVILENTLLALIGAILGLVLAYIIAAMMGGIEITIELPWDLSSTPHFLPEATLDRNTVVTAPVEIPWQLMVITGLGGVLVGFLAAIIAVYMKRPAAWSLLGSE